jgi:hypothetical protein
MTLMRAYFFVKDIWCSCWRYWNNSTCDGCDDEIRQVIPIFYVHEALHQKNVDSNGSYDCIHWFCCLGFLSMKRTRSSGVHLLDKWEPSCGFLSQHLYFHSKKLNHSHTKKSLRTVLYVKLHMARRWVICLFKFVL